MPSVRVTGAGAVCAGLGAYAAVLRPRLNRFGASDAELHSGFPGDDLIPDPYTVTTMATTIDAPPSAVWPWLVQMGCDRAGFYSFDRLDNGGRPSATRIHAEWQDLTQGGRILSVPDGSFWFDVAILEPERTLVLRRDHTTCPGATRGRAATAPGAFTCARPATGRTRLVVHGRGAGRPRRLVSTINHLFWEPAHWVMQLRQFAGLRRRTATGAV